MSVNTQSISSGAMSKSRITDGQLVDGVDLIEVLSFAGDWLEKPAILCESLDHNKISSTLASELRLVITAKDGRRETELRYRVPGKAASIKHAFRVEACDAQSLVIGDVGFEFLKSARRGSFVIFGSKQSKEEQAAIENDKKSYRLQWQQEQEIEKKRKRETMLQDGKLREGKSQRVGKENNKPKS